MRTIKAILVLAFVFACNNLSAQTVVKMDMPQQADHPLSIVALFDEEIPEGIQVVIGLMGYNIEGGKAPFNYEWLVNGTVKSTNDILIFTPKKGDDLSLKVIDNNKCRATTSFNLKFAKIPQNPNKEEVKGIEVYPTVVKDFIQIKFKPEAGKKALIRIFNSDGR
ncbi:MAG TPA: hypothetical protein VLZ72_04430, partial [Flavobacterium sp.]|nr:hypothetical protein [Flavobacterium sp.]